MADHSKPTLSSTYPNFLNEVKGRLEDISKQFDPAQGAASNVVAGTVRWSSSSKKWEQWNGTAWGDLATEYAINTSGSAAKLKTARSIAVSGGATAAAVPFDGSANVTLNVTALNPAQLSAVVPVNKGGTGSATAEQARVNLGLGSAATTNAADYAAKSHAHAWGEITGKPATFPPVIGGAANQAKAGNWNPSWNEVQGKPATFPPVVGYAAHQAKPGSWRPQWSDVDGKPEIAIPAQSLSAGAVGTYALATNTGNHSVGYGGTNSGTYTRIVGIGDRSGTTSIWGVPVYQLHQALPGTWRNLGPGVQGGYTVCLWVRIA